jgi:formylglycine-generating enzyme required for sulfatase activity
VETKEGRPASRVVPLAGLAAALVVAACAGRQHASEKALADLASGKMAQLSGGTLLLGELTGPAHNVVEYEPIGTFLLDVTEVTVGAYGECVRAGRCTPAGSTVVSETLWRNPEESSADCNRDRADRADHPVNCVDWDQASAYCAWAGKRLPSEQEWEWAARNGGAGTLFPWGNELPRDRACWRGDGNDLGGTSGTCAVGSHPGDATRSGVKDLAGDVWEWTSTPAVVGADSRGRGGTPVRVARGGSWSDDDPRSLFASRRLEVPTQRRDPRLGFRCASHR